VYIVEKWACSRVQPTFVINTYTGEPSHTVTVNVLGVPADQSAWSHRLRLYFDAASSHHVHTMDTPLGSLMVTSLSSFPSDLNVIPVPSGDVSDSRSHFVVNEDLKRLGCSGRSGFTLSHPSPTTEAKFYQLYKTSERVPLYEAVIELVKQCQMALSIFDMLAAEYVDGLLCDLTEKAIANWWTEIGTDLYNADPTDGILGPSTVAALLGTLMGARNRLHAYGAPVTKNVFDVSTLKRGIASFQKSQKLERTRRLDRQTLDRLHRVTAKAAAGDVGWAVPRAVKSTVVELGGKGGEMVMGMVGGKEKAGISEVETLDIERFAQLVIGERSKWLWLGKPRKTGIDVFRQHGRDEPMVFTQDDQGNYIWTSSRKEKEPVTYRQSFDEPPERHISETSAAYYDERGGGIKKSVSIKVSDAKAGLGRFRDAVGIPGLRSHHSRRSKETIYEDDDVLLNRRGASLESTREETAGIGRPSMATERGSPGYAEPLTLPPHGEALSDISGVSARGDTAHRIAHQLSAPAHLEHPDETEHGSSNALSALDERLAKGTAESQVGDRSTKSAKVFAGEHIFRHYRRSRSADPISASQQRQRRREMADAIGSCEPEPESESESESEPDPDSHPPAGRLLRHLSFSVAEASILTWTPITDIDTSLDTAVQDIDKEMARENYLVTLIQRLNKRVTWLAQDTVPWVNTQISGLQSLESECQTHTTQLQQLYQSKLDDFRALQNTVTGITTRESAQAADEIKKVELLGAKLDYEISVLQSKVADVEAGVSDYEAHVERIERRMRRVIGPEGHAARVAEARRSWLSWLQGLWASVKSGQS
ncbi:hypothetical protein KEM52_005273, partial [Ascosphaera acerosa]